MKNLDLGVFGNGISPIESCGWSPSHPQGGSSRTGHFPTSLVRICRSVTSVQTELRGCNSTTLGHIVKQTNRTSTMKKTKAVPCFAFLLAVFACLAATGRASRRARHIEFVNRSGKHVVVDWIDPTTGAAVTMYSDLMDGQVSSLDTFVNHTFAIHEMSNESSSAETSEVRYITVSENEEQVAFIKRGLSIQYEDSSTKAQTQAAEMTNDCQQAANTKLENGENPSEVVEELSRCLEEKTVELIKKKNDEIAFESQVRLAISNQLENHTCADVNKETTEPREVRSWTHDNTERDVLVVHDRPSSQIHVIKNFISPDECAAITEAAKPLLHRGTVADGKGGSKLSDHRKAMQAGVRVPWEEEANGDPIARVVRRLYDYTNDAVGYNLTIEGQEDLMSIQYFGVGRNSSEAFDQYRPHCDGECDGLPHKDGGRVATMVMYCDIEGLVGGATNFQNAGVFVKPELGAAAFFSYMDPVTKLTENGFTSHSGCPVVEGTKKIAVHWMRIGVDEANPWSSFNTLTVKKEEEGN
eukprot:scaffold5024_cov136-Cylindrotheca_fusiformis.AAC.8